MHTEKNMKRKLRALALILAPALVFAACTSPAAETKAAEGVSYSIGIDGVMVNADNLEKGIKELVQRLVAEGSTSDGTTPERGLKLVVGGGDLRLGDENSMQKLFLALEDYYVHLDLSGVPGTQFSYIPALEPIDRTKVLSITFSNYVTRFKASSDGTNNTFNDFPGLQSISAQGVKTVGAYTFDYLMQLVEVYLPNAETIGAHAFEGCSAIETISLPAALTINNNAFRGCLKLKDLNLPKATLVDTNAIRLCTSLASINLPEVTTLGQSVFESCTSLAEVKMPKVGNIGTGVAATTFALTGGVDLAITLGSVPPNIGTQMFNSITVSKNVVVYRPAGATAAYTDDWKQGLQGKGWTAGTVGAADVNSNISITYQNTSE